MQVTENNGPNHPQHNSADTDSITQDVNVALRTSQHLSALYRAIELPLSLLVSIIYAK